MTDDQLTTLSTIAWLVGTSLLFVLLAHWSTGGSWDISSAIARGLTGWTRRNGSPGHPAGDLPPMAPPQLDRLWGVAGRTEAARPAVGVDVADEPAAELEDLGSRRLR
jgi:hypothetical protein